MSGNYPPEYEDFILCEKFGWTPKQIDEQDERVLRIFLKIMEFEALQAKKQNALNSI
jgi:hypothetical protein